MVHDPFDEFEREVKIWHPEGETTATEIPRGVSLEKPEYIRV